MSNDYRPAPPVADFAELGAILVGTSGGVRLYRFVRDRVRDIVYFGHYPPLIYASEPTWTDGAIDDVAQDVFAGPLYGEGQYRYALDHANDLHHFRALIDMHIRRTLGDRVAPTIVGNLGRRAVSILEKDSDSFVADDLPGQVRAFRLRDRVPASEDRYPTEAEIRAAAMSLAGAEDAIRRPSRPAGPGGVTRTYTNDQLHEILGRIGREIPCWFRRRDIEETLARLLAEEGSEPLAEEPESSEDDRRGAAAFVGQVGEMGGPITPSAALIAGQAADRAIARLSARAREVLFLRLDLDAAVGTEQEPKEPRWLSDVEIAGRLGCGPKAVAAARAEAATVFTEEFAGLPPVAIPLAEEALIDRVLRPAD